MPNTVLTPTLIREDIELRLGGSGVAVELDDKDYAEAIRHAVRVYNRNKPQHRFNALAVSKSTKKYGPLPDPGIQGIVRACFVSVRFEFGDPFDSPFYRDRTGLSVLGDTFGEFDQKLQYLEQSRRIAGVEPEWQQQWEGSDLFLYIDVSDIPYDFMYEYTWHVTPDDNAATGMQFIQDGDTDWILDFIEAKMMQRLGRIRGKFAGIADPQGGTSEIDWREMSEDGKEKEQRLMEEIQRRRRPLPPVFE